MGKTTNIGGVLRPSVQAKDLVERTISLNEYSTLGRWVATTGRPVQAVPLLFPGKTHTSKLDIIDPIAEFYSNSLSKPQER